MLKDRRSSSPRSFKSPPEKEPSITLCALKYFSQHCHPIYVNMSLNAPHSGWANLLTYLKESGLDSSINLGPDKRYEPYADATALILEMKTGSRYTMAYYLDSTASDDGKKAFAICEKIRNEFDILLGCKS